METKKIPFSQSLIDFEGKRVELLSLGDCPADKTIVLIHGFNKFGAWEMLLPAYRLHRSGYCVLLPSQAGFGASDGPRDFCGPQTIHGTGNAITQILNGQGKAALWGISRGAIVAGQLTALYPTLFSSVVLQAGAYDLEKDYNWESKSAEIKENMSLETEGASKEALRSRSLIHVVEKVEVPALVLHGKKDESISVGQAYDLQKRLEELKKESELVTFQEKGHHLSSPELRKKYILPFIEKYL